MILEPIESRVTAIFLDRVSEISGEKISALLSPLTASTVALHRVPGELKPVLQQYGQTREASIPRGKVRASSKGASAPLRENPVFGRTGCGPGLSTGALTCAARFRLRYSRIHAALRAGSR